MNSMNSMNSMNPMNPHQQDVQSHDVTLDIGGSSGSGFITASVVCLSTTH